MSGGGSRRTSVRVAAALLAGLMVGSAVLTYLSYTAAFTSTDTVTVSSPRAGLVMEKGAKVKYRGIQVGKVTDISYSGNQARLKLAIDTPAPPPNDNGPPPPFTSWMPPGYPPEPPQVPYPATIPPPPPPEGTGPPPGPAPGPQPQASGPAYTIYDQLSGAFADPAGGTGIFAPGMTGASSAENWVDLMRDPRQL